HVTDRQIVCAAIWSLLPPGGFLILTVPYRFPYHEDPIDTMFRPSVEELAQLFPGTAIQQPRSSARVDPRWRCRECAGRCSACSSVRLCPSIVLDAGGR